MLDGAKITLFLDMTRNSPSFLSVGLSKSKNAWFEAALAFAAAKIRNYARIYKTRQIEPSNKAN